jgi:hypothetical protein
MREKKKKRKEKNQGRRRTNDAGFGRNKRRKVGWVIILCSCFYLVNLSLVRLG